MCKENQTQIRHLLQYGQKAISRHCPFTAAKCNDNQQPRMRSNGEHQPDLGLQVLVPLHRHHHEQSDGRLRHPWRHQVDGLTVTSNDKPLPLRNGSKKLAVTRYRW